VIPRVAQLDNFSGPIPDTALAVWSRAQALRTIAFDSSAELELRAGYAATRAPQLLLGIAEAAVAAARYSSGIVTMRQIVPQMEARRLEDVPDAIWQAGFPLPYRTALEREAHRNNVDPMLVAGLIRQESAFASGAVSRAGAVGLMQVMPPTGAKMARRLKVRFSRARLFDPEYNLQLGELYISGLLNSYPAPEFALAAFNAGENRVTAWTDGQKYEETPEFVESIPFTETREYVQTVLRNAELYRHIYNRPALAESGSPALARP
jgi:soluble lytic murein transglycosylase